VSATEGLSPTGERLLSMGKELASEARAGDAPVPLSEFVQTYREWISLERGRSGTQAEQAERWQLVVNGMLSAPDLAGAIELLIRYAKVIWEGRGPCELRLDEKEAILVFSEPHRPGPEGLIAAIWPLALTICQLEFLAGTSLAGAKGSVRHTPCLPEAMADLLFGRPITFGQKEVALIFPRHHLHRPVVARAADLPRFFRELLPLTLGAKRNSPSVESLVCGLLRDDKRGPEFRDSGFAEMAIRLGMSGATLRRRLAQEGTSFRKIRDQVYDELARAWLQQEDIAVEEIAARLGYSDTFAFRRFFRRTNGCSPTAYRRGTLP